MRTFVFFAILFVFGASAAFAQPRPIEKAEKPAVQLKPAPETFVARYEGGLVGYSRKIEGTVKFDDPNDRIVFFDEEKKEVFGIPYRAMLIVSPQSQSVQTTAGKVVGAVFSSIVGGFIKEKRRYLIIQFDDPDVDAKGLVNFRIEDKEILDSVIADLAKKAELKQRGDAYYRPKKTGDGN